MSEPTTKSVLVRYREKGGRLKFEIISGTDAQIEATLNNYLETKDAHSLLVLGEVGTSTNIANIVVVEELHHYLVQEGVAYIGSDIDTDVDTAQPKYWHIRCDAEIPFHLAMTIASSGAGTVELFEGATINAEGTTIVCYNVNRTKAESTEGHFCRDPTVGADGTRIFVSRVGTEKSTRVGGEIRADQYIIQHAVDYLIKFTPDANDASVTLVIEVFGASH